MSQILIGAIALVGVLWLLKSYTKASPTKMGQLIRKGGGLLAVAAGALLLMRGRVDMAIPLIFLGLGILGWLPSMPGIPGIPGLSGGARANRTPGQVSQVRSATLDMELEHDTGAMRGTVLSGRFKGRRLDDLGPPDFQALYVEIAGDPDGRSLLEAYLDRRFAGWREHFQKDAGAGSRERARSSSAMSKEEAHQILGVQPGASIDDIRAAHRSLMKKLHPDQGGSTYLAARVNEAKEVLLGSHG